MCPTSSNIMSHFLPRGFRSEQVSVLLSLQNHYLPRCKPENYMEHEGWSFQENYNLSTNRRSTRREDELVELLWRDGQVIIQSQTQKQDHHQEALRSNNVLEDQETISWIQDEDPFETDEFFSTERQRPVSETVKHVEGPDPRVMPPPKFTLMDSSSGNKEQYSVMTIGPSHYGSYQSQNDHDMLMSHDRSKNIDEGVYRNTTSSSGESFGYNFGKNIKEIASGRSITTDPKRNPIIDTQADAIDNKSNQRSGSSRRSRAAQVHNLSERRRRDRINERIKTLQELIPHCSKIDKASILDAAIDYLKSLQLQIQVMWMGSGMPASGPMMFPGLQLPRFPAMDRLAIQNNPGLICQNPVQNQVLSNRFGRYIGGQPVEMMRFESPTREQRQQPSTAMKTTENRRLNQ